MGMFIEIPACSKSIRQRRLIHGVGINDATYNVSTFIDGKQVVCPFYLKWKSMLDRCYIKTQKTKYPNYIGCTVCNEWLLFSKFKEWMIKQCWKGKELDKDLLIKGSKKYSPETCLFVTKELNGLLNDSKVSRGSYPQGVSYEKDRNSFKASCSVNGKMKNLGRFKTIKEASKSYIQFKNLIITEFSNKLSEPLKSALLLHKLKYIEV